MSVQTPSSGGRAANNLPTSSMSIQPAAGFDRIGSTTGFTGMPGFGGHQFGTGFERLSSVPYTPGIVDKLAGGDSNQFSRLASLGNFAVAPGNTFARVPSTVNNLPSDAFTRAASSFIPFPNASFERVSSLAGNAAQLQDADAHGKGVSSAMSGITGGMVGYPQYQVPLPKQCSAGFTRAPSMGQSMAGLPFGLFQGQTAGSGALGKEGMGHMAQMGMTHTPAGRVPNMDMAWQRTMSGGTDMFARTASAAGFPSMVGQEASQGLMTAMGHWDPAALGGTGNVAMDVWGGMHGGMHASMPHHAGLHNFGFSHEHMPMMAPSMYAPHGLQQHGLQMAAPMATGRPHLSDAPEDTGKGKKGRGKNKANKSRAMPSDAEAGARKKRRAEKREGAGSGGEGEDDRQGFEKHNQFLWAKRMGQQNEPRWGLFKQGGSAGPAFLKLLEDLEQDNIIERQFSQEVPETLTGVSGWIVKEGMMEEWQRRRQAWFMEGKEGKEYKPNSLYQIMRRLGFFPTMRSSRAGHGHDFEGSSVFRWDSDRKYSQRRKSSKGGSEDAMADNKLHTQLGVVKPIGVQAVGGHLHQAVGGHLHHNGIVSGIQSAGIQSAMHPFGMAVIRKHP